MKHEVAFEIQWYARHHEENDGSQNLKPVKKSLLIEVNCQEVLNANGETLSLTTYMLVDGFDCSHKTIVLILHELGKIWKKTR